MLYNMRQTDSSSLMISWDCSWYSVSVLQLTERRCGQMLLTSFISETMCLTTSSNERLSLADTPIRGRRWRLCSMYTPLYEGCLPPPSLQATPLLAVLFTPQGNAYPNTPDPAGESLRCPSCSLVRWGRALCLAVFPAYTPHRVTFWIEAYLTQPSTKTRSGRMMMPLAASTESFSLATLDFETSLVPLDGKLADSLNASNDVQSLLVAALIH